MKLSSPIESVAINCGLKYILFGVTPIVSIESVSIRGITLRAAKKNGLTFFICSMLKAIICSTDIDASDASEAFTIVPSGSTLILLLRF